MKRSEMVNLLTDQFIQRDMASDLGAKVAANEILTILEQYGILPPFVDKSANEYYEDGNWIDLHVNDAVYAGQCKWEKENE